MQHDRGPGTGPADPDDGDDFGPPDWFAAVAEPEPAHGAARGVETVGDGLGLVSASELPTGRRRRRSALIEEAAPGDGGEAAGHGGAAASASPARASARRARARAGREESDGLAADGPAGRSTGRTRRAGGRGGTDGTDGTGTAKAARGSGPAGAQVSADPEAQARDICLRLLTGAAKSRKQLADALRKREIPHEAAEAVLDRLEEVGLIDDAAFARAWVESRHAVRGLSRRALAQELRTKGVAAELVEQAVAQLDQDDETEAARALVERKLRVTRGLERQARMRRLVGVLARRGYSEGLAFRVVREALDEEAAGFGPYADLHADFHADFHGGGDGRNGPDGSGEDVDGPSVDGWE
ncbi:regulatory protein RecX [Kitasatospora sp. NPDC058170]|uniref:regulatory protein RecX n=1 Tax=Kitasatospora sp. NPDC058170 TaxID=3346364 RepID=UPI0036DCD82D